MSSRVDIKWKGKVLLKLNIAKRFLKTLAAQWFSSTLFTSKGKPQTRAVKNEWVSCSGYLFYKTKTEISVFSRG